MKPHSFSTTDDFFFHSTPCGIVEIGFGATSVRMTQAAAEDLSYRLSSYLVFLKHGPQDRATVETAEPMEPALPVLTLVRSGEQR